MDRQLNPACRHLEDPTSLNDGIEEGRECVISELEQLNAGWCGQSFATSYLHQAILAFTNPMVSSSFFFVCAKTWEEKSCLQRKRLFVEWTAGPYTAENSYLLSVEYLPLHAGLRFAFVLQLGSSYVRHDLDDFIFCLEGSAVSAIVMSDIPVQRPVPRESCVTLEPRAIAVET